MYEVLKSLYSENINMDKVNDLILSGYKGKKYKSDKILVLIPHCMQNSLCKQDLISNINNCTRCGNCAISELLDIIWSKRIKTIVVKGGTAARSIVFETKPSLIIAIACERELKSGINDIGEIPVVGVINSRPFGDCNNTSVDIELFKDYLLQVVL